MEEVFAYVIAVWFITATVCTVQFAVADYRDFSNIVKQCEKQGFIQDKTIRVSCSLEK